MHAQRQLGEDPEEMGPFYLFTQLSSGNSAVGVAFPFILRLAGFHPSSTQPIPFCLVIELICHDSVWLRDSPSEPGCFVEPAKKKDTSWRVSLFPFSPLVLNVGL